MPRIVFTTWGSLGDLHPYLSLALELKRRGHDVAIATVVAWRTTVEQSGLEFRPLRPNVSPDDPHAREIVRRILDARGGPEYLFTRVLGPALRESYDDTMAAVADADLLVSHQIPLASPIVAGQTGMKWVSGVLAPMSFLSAYDPPTPPQAPWVRAVAAFHPVLGGAFRRLGRLVTRPWVEPVYRLRAQLGMPRGGNPMFEGQHSPACVLALFSSVLARTEPDYPPRTVITGFPFHDAAPGSPVDAGLLRFLDAGEPPVVFTLGSSAVWIARDFYEVSVAAVRDLGRRALLLVGENAAELRKTLPDTIGVFDYAPHEVVMPRASLIVHQGGIGTTAQALRAGRPMLVVPFGQDQPDNARRVVQLGVARTMARRRYTAGTLKRELSALLTDRAYADRAASVGNHVRAEHGTEKACDAIEHVLGG